MLEALKFVQGAVAKKSFTPELTHFRIENGTIKGFNGALSLCSPIDLDLEITPLAVPFIKAIAACRATTSMSITPAGRLSIKSGKFKAFIECINEEYPDVQPEGKMIEVKGEFIATLKALAPYMAEDASRPWARGICLRGQSAYVTNNIIIIQAWLKTPFPVEVNIPAPAIKEIIRIGSDPTAIQMADNSITFHYADGRWLRTNTSSLDWPGVDAILDRESNQVALPETFFAGLEDLRSFTDDVDRVHFLPDKMVTSLDDGVGASYAIDGLPEGAFNIKQLQLLQSIIKTIDFTMYPKPCLFYGDNIRGAIVGMRN